MQELPTVPPIDRAFEFGQPVSERFKSAAGYQADDDLQAAVQVALLLGMPLLLTGEPGCGKTSLAGWLAWKLQLGDPLVYNVKSTSSGRELLYECDELSRFRDAQAGKADRSEADYIKLNALGLSITLSMGPGKLSASGPAGKSLEDRLIARQMESLEFGRRYVVLIDELDKAPRDTPNDLLLEILEMKFHIRELDLWIRGEPAHRPIVIITSNSEKSLPEPFLRRCIFHHIRSPDDAARRAIVQGRMHPFVQRGELFDKAMRLFDRLAGNLGRSPGTAELLAWLTVLESRLQHLESAEPEAQDFKELVTGTLGTLAKTREDRDRAEAVLADKS